jgi:hypothetical protein
MKKPAHKRREKLLRELFCFRAAERLLRRRADEIQYGILYTKQEINGDMYEAFKWQSGEQV